MGRGGWVVEGSGGEDGWVVEGSGGEGWVGGYWSSGAVVVEAGCLCTLYPQPPLSYTLLWVVK